MCSSLSVEQLEIVSVKSRIRNIDIGRSLMQRKSDLNCTVALSVAGDKRAHADGDKRK